MRLSNFRHFYDVFMQFKLALVYRPRVSGHSLLICYDKYTRPIDFTLSFFSCTPFNHLDNGSSGIWLDHLKIKGLRLFSRDFI